MREEKRRREKEQKPSPAHKHYIFQKELAMPLFLGVFAMSFYNSCSYQCSLHNCGLQIFQNTTNLLKIQRDIS